MAMKSILKLLLIIGIVWMNEVKALNFRIGKFRFRFISWSSTSTTSLDGTKTKVTTFVFIGLECEDTTAALTSTSSSKRRLLLNGTIIRYNITIDFDAFDYYNLYRIAECLDDEMCSDMLEEYNSDTTEQDVCDSFSCDSTSLQLLENAVAEVIEYYPCPACGRGYSYINDGTARTWQESRDYCIDEMDSDLATITSPLDMYYAQQQIDDGPSPFSGLTMIGERDVTYWYEFVDGTECPTKDNGKYSGACLSKPLWLNEEPRECTVGSKCTRILPEIGKIDNDIMCASTLDAVLCNCPGAGYGDPTIEIVENAGSITKLLQIDIDHTDDAGTNSVWKYFNNSQSSIITFGAFLIFLLISYTFICYWCTCIEGKQTVQQYDKVVV